MTNRWILKGVCSRTVENMKRNGNRPSIDRPSTRPVSGTQTEQKLSSRYNSPSTSWLRARKFQKERGLLYCCTREMYNCIYVGGGGAERQFHCRTHPTLLLKSYKNITKEGREWSSQSLSTQEQAKKEGLERAFIPADPLIKSAPLPTEHAERVMLFLKCLEVRLCIGASLQYGFSKVNVQNSETSLQRTQRMKACVIFIQKQFIELSTTVHIFSDNTVCYILWCVFDVSVSTSRLLFILGGILTVWCYKQAGLQGNACVLG